VNPRSDAPNRCLPTVDQAVEALSLEFDFGEHGQRTRLSYRSGARAFLRFIEQQDSLSPDTPIDSLASSITADFNAWMQNATHTRPGPEVESDDKAPQEGYSISTRRLYLQALSRRLRFWWYREWLTFSPEEETRAKKALQIQHSRDDRRLIQTRSGAVPTDFGDRMLATAIALPLPTEENVPHPRARRKAQLEILPARSLVYALRAVAMSLRSREQGFSSRGKPADTYGLRQAI